MTLKDLVFFKNNIYTCMRLLAQVARTNLHVLHVRENNILYKEHSFTCTEKIPKLCSV